MAIPGNRHCANCIGTLWFSIWTSEAVLFTAGSNLYNENETIAKFEIMDGAPVRGRYFL